MGGAGAGEYLYLNPEKAGFLNLSRFLLSGNIHGKPFIESQHANVEHRRYIILFIILQKFLHAVAFPMALAGDLLEFFLNLLELNGGFFRLFLNIILWKMKIPEKGSVNYLSAIGFFDRRTELDKSIKPGDNKYLAYLSLMASKIAYENQAFTRAVVQDQWKIMKEEPYKNYFTIRAFLIREFDTLWELLRSFVIRHMYGAECEEDVMSWLFRLSGVLFSPGIPAHFLRDYINSIKLGTDNFFD